MRPKCQDQCLFQNSLTTVLRLIIWNIFHTTQFAKDVSRQIVYKATTCWLAVCSTNCTSLSQFETRNSALRTSVAPWTYWLKDLSWWNITWCGVNCGVKKRLLRKAVHTATCQLPSKPCWRIRGKEHSLVEVQLHVVMMVGYLLQPRPK